MEYSYRRIFAFFWKFIAPYRWYFVLGTTLSIISSGAALYPVYIFGQIVDLLSTSTTPDVLVLMYPLLGLWFGAIAVRHVLGFFSRYINYDIAERMTIDAEMYSVKHISKLDLGWHEKENTGNKLKRISRGAESVQTIVRIWTNSIISMIVNFVGAITILYQFDTRLAIFVVIYQIIYYIIAPFTRGRAVLAMRAVNIKDEEVSGLWFEIVSNIRSVKVLGMATKIFEYTKTITEDLASLIKKRIFWFQWGTASQSLWEGLVRVILILYVIWGITEGRYELGFLVIFYGYFNTVTDAVSKFTDVAQDMAKSRVNIGRLAELLDEPVVIDDEKGKVDFPSTWDLVRINGLTFSYGDNRVLENLTFDIKKGQKIGIVGLSGAGKSTLFKLLLKEHESYEGDILIGDVPLRSIKKSSYVNHIAVVLQETEVFNMILRQNIFLANSKEEHNKELFDRALTTSHVHDFLSKLPLGTETLIGEKGIKLSGGEKQRLGIARAVFKDPEILFLDEATSHLDVESEQKIQDSLKKFFQGVTAVVIAHRLSTVREMDKILVIEGGKIIETGTFDELNKKSGRFREFWDKQKM